jgi:hypothetical protein
MSRALPYTVGSIARRIKGIEKAGRFAIGLRPDGTLIIGDKPMEPASLAPPIPEQSVPLKRRIGDKVHGGKGEA